MVLGRFLSDTDPQHGLSFDDLPIQAAKTKPTVVYADGFFDSIAYGVDHVDRIAFVVWLLYEDVDVDLGFDRPDACFPDCAKDMIADRVA